MKESMHSWFPGGASLTAGDYLVLVVSLTVMFGIGWWASRAHRSSTRDLFLGGRRIPWWVAMLSFVATEISAMTIIGVPAATFRENWNYAQFFIGSAAARVMIAFLFIPAFYSYNSTTIYEYLRTRFGPRTQYCATGFFFVTRLLASGVRLRAACLAVAVLIGWGEIPTIILFSLIGIVYIAYGGITAVVWTNVMQALAFLGAGLLSIFFILGRVEGGLPAALHLAGEAGKLDIFRWGPAPWEPGFLKAFFTDPNILLIAILNGFFGSAAAFGTDHEMTQKLLTVETRRDSQKTILLSIAGSLMTLLVFMGVGTALFVYYKQNPGMALPEKLDSIYPHFASTVMPVFLRGAVLTAIVMASIDSPLASLTAVFVTDLYKPLFRPDAPQEHYVKVTTRLVVAFAIGLAFIAWWFSRFDKMLWVAFKIGGVTYGSLLGIFLLGMTTKRKADRAAVVAMISMAVINGSLLYLSETKVFPIAWSWLVIIGTLGTYGLGWVLGPVLDDEGVKAKA